MLLEPGGAPGELSPQLNRNLRYLYEHTHLLSPDRQINGVKDECLLLIEIWESFAD